MNTYGIHTMTMDTDTLRLIISDRPFPGRWSVEVCRPVPNDTGVTAWVTADRHVVATIEDALNFGESVLERSANPCRSVGQ